MILLDTYTPSVSIYLGSGDMALFVVAIIIVAICAVPFLFRR